MKQKKIIAALAALILFSSIPAVAGEAELKDNMALAQLLENIVAPVLTGNPDLCGDYVRPYLGAEFLTLEGVSEDYREPVARLYNVGAQPTVTIIGRGSPADGALMRGDRITHVNGRALAEGNQGQDELMREAENAQGEIILTAERDGQVREVAVSPVPVCAPLVRLGMRESAEIWAEGEKVFVSKGLLRAGNEERIAALLKTKLRAMTGE